MYIGVYIGGGDDCFFLNRNFFLEKKTFELTSNLFLQFGRGEGDGRRNGGWAGRGRGNGST